MTRTRRLVIIAAAGTLAAGCGPTHSATPTPTPSAERAAWTGHVLSVADGDTLDVDRDGTRTRVRLLSIDAPEVAHDGEPADCGGEVARRALDSKTWRHEVTVVPDRTADTTDRYGRTLAYVYVGQLDVGMAQVSDGYAAAWAPRSAPRASRQDAYDTAQQLAQRGKRGSWKTCPTLGRT